MAKNFTPTTNKFMRGYVKPGSMRGPLKTSTEIAMGAAVTAPMAKGPIAKSAAEAKKIVDRFVVVKGKKGEVAATKDMLNYVKKHSSDRIKSLWGAAEKMSATEGKNLISPMLKSPTMPKIGTNITSKFLNVGKGATGAAGAIETAGEAAGAVAKKGGLLKVGTTVGIIFIGLLMVEKTIGDIVASQDTPKMQELVGRLNLLSQGINPDLKKEEIAENMLNQQKIQHLAGSLAGKQTALANLQSPGSALPVSLSAPAVAQGEELIGGAGGQEGSPDQQTLMNMLQGAIGG